MEPVTLPMSPSLLHNNLVSSGRFLAYVSNVRPNPQTILISSESLNTSFVVTSQVKYKNEEEVLSLNYVNLLSQWYLVLGFNHNVQIWNEEGNRMCGHLGFDDIEGADSETYFIGSSGSDSAQAIVVGCSIGCIALIGQNPESLSTFSMKNSFFCSRNEPIATVSVFENKVLTFGENGLGVFWDLKANGEFSYIEGPKVSATVSVVIKKYAVVGFGSGEIRVVNMKTQQFLCKIWSHTRWITGICRHETRPIFVTCSEDCTVAAWALRNGEVELVDNKEFPNILLTGVSLMEEKILVVGYDRPKLIIESLL